jgi:hydroxyethylthiazole kinase
MAHAPEEAGDMAGIASSLVLNIGTLTNALVESMIIAGKSANRKGIPVVLDAVGAGATRLRDEKASEILREVKVAIIKGNASEIARLAGENVVTKGVEATDTGKDPAQIALRLAESMDSVVVITAAEDIAAGNGVIYKIMNGHAMMGSIVGTGCMAASVIGAFAAVERDHAKAAAAALSAYGIAGELAAKISSGPGTFKTLFYDEIYNLDREKIERMAKIEKRDAR